MEVGQKNTLYWGRNESILKNSKGKNAGEMTGVGGRLRHRRKKKKAIWGRNVTPEKEMKVAKQSARIPSVNKWDGTKENQGGGESILLLGADILIRT